MNIELEDAKNFLAEKRLELEYNQRLQKKEIEDAFKILWDSNPDEDEFDEFTDGLIFTPIMLHYVVTPRIRPE